MHNEDTRTLNRGSMAKIAAFAGLLAAAACGTVSAPQPPPTVQLEQHGVSPATLSLESGSALQFINADLRPHQIYSNDCQELASGLLPPGHVYNARIGSGPKLCHFQDLLALAASEYWGTVEVQEVQEVPDEPSGGG